MAEQKEKPVRTATPANGAKPVKTDKSAAPTSVVQASTATTTSASVAPASTTPKSPVVVKQKVRRVVPRGRMYVQATFNNTIITITDEGGNTVCWGSTGNSGFSGSRKSTPYAATVSVEKAIGKAREMGMRSVEVFIKGPGPGRDAALRVLRASGLQATMIADVTPVPHNGTKPRKLRHG